MNRLSEDKIETHQDILSRSLVGHWDVVGGCSREIYLVEADPIKTARKFNAALRPERNDEATGMRMAGSDPSVRAGRLYVSHEAFDYIKTRRNFTPVVKAYFHPIDMPPVLKGHFQTADYLRPIYLSGDPQYHYNKIQYSLWAVAISTEISNVPEALVVSPKLFTERICNHPNFTHLEVPPSRELVHEDNSDCEGCRLNIALCQGLYLACIRRAGVPSPSESDRQISKEAWDKLKKEDELNQRPYPDDVAESHSAW